MPVYNAEKYLNEAIESILNQTFTDFEFLIFNDGSIDKSCEIITSYNDKRIKFFNYNKNLGLIKHLNEGIRISEGKYIARMDADDISLPQRLEKQLEFLESNPEIGICSCSIRIFGTKEEILYYPKDDNNIKIKMLNNSSISHPSAILRSDLIKSTSLKFDENYIHTEDYKFWLELLKYTKAYNIPEILYLYRYHDENVTLTNKELISINKIKIQKNYIEYLTSTEYNQEEAFLIIDAINNPWSINSSFIFITEQFLKIIHFNKTALFFSNQFIIKELSTRWIRFIFKKKLNINDSKYLFSPLMNSANIITKTKYLIKCFINL